MDLAFTITTRRKNGQALTALIAFIGISILTALGILSFEISRYALAKEQLKNCVDAAALAGQATLATYSTTGAKDSLTQSGYNNAAAANNAQAAAVNAALQIFRQNSVLGLQLTEAALPQGIEKPNQPPNLPPNHLPNPGANQAVVSVEFLTPSAGASSATANPTTAPTAADQKMVKVSAGFGVTPAFANFSWFGIVPAWSSATAAMPMTDVIDCFDVSGSMDDQTKVTFVKRVWSPNGYVDYQPVNTASGGVAEGTICQILGSPARGTNVNALEPQGLENASNATNPLYFSEAQPSTHLLRGVSNTGSPPGNSPGQVMPPNKPPAAGGKDVFTDLVVNLDGNSHFGGFVSPNGYSFPNLGVLVEAQRGNLENDTVFKAAGLAGNSNFSAITPRPGYKLLGYEYNAQSLLQPFNTARSAALNFSYVLLHTNNCQLGEISFSDHVGNTDLSTFTAPNVSSLYPQADFPTPASFMLPNQYEQPMTDQLFGVYKELVTSGSARVCGQTSNVSACLLQVVGNERAAINWLNDPVHHRANADRVIVLFTNSAPTQTELAPARNAAHLANTYGIPIYVVGLAETSGTQSAQMAAYNDSNTDGGSGGICAIAGHGSRFFQVTDESDVPQAFGNVLRQLVKLVQ